MNLFMFSNEYPHRHSPMSFLIRCCCSLRLCAMQNFFGSSTVPCGYRDCKSLSQGNAAILWQEVFRYLDGDDVAFCTDVSAGGKIGFDHHLAVLYFGYA